jgi:hypothetical protein
MLPHAAWQPRIGRHDNLTPPSRSRGFPAFRRSRA